MQQLTENIYIYIVDVHLYFLDVLDVEGQRLHHPVLSPAVHGRLDDKDVRRSLFASASPLFTAAEQHLLQIAHVPGTAR